jgi:hypothetical protein
LFIPFNLFFKNMKLKLLFVVVLVAVSALSFRSLQNDKSLLEKYSTVKVYLNSENDFKTLAINDIDYQPEGASEKVSQ